MSKIKATVYFSQDLTALLGEVVKAECEAINTYAKGGTTIVATGHSMYSCRSDGDFLNWLREALGDGDGVNVFWHYTEGFGWYVIIDECKDVCEHKNIRISGICDDCGEITTYINDKGV